MRDPCRRDRRLTPVGTDEQTSRSLRKMEIDVLERLFTGDAFRVVALVRETQLLDLDRGVFRRDGHDDVSSSSLVWLCFSRFKVKAI